MLERLRHFFTAPEQKASRTARLFHLESGGRARWTPRDYTALTREGYGKNAIVHRAVRLIAESIGGLTFLLYEGDAELERHPLLDLLARPNPRQDGAAFLEAVTAHLLLAGNAYIEAVALDTQKGADVRELYALRPDRIKVVPGPEGWPEAYDYTIGARSVRFTQGGDVPPILHLALFNPLDDHYGLAPLEAAAVAVELTLFECPGFSVALFHALWSGAPQAVNGFVELSGLIMAYMAARFGVLGVYVSGRSKEKQAARGQPSPSLIGSAIDALKRVR